MSIIMIKMSKYSNMNLENKNKNKIETTSSNLIRKELGRNMKKQFWMKMSQASIKKRLKKYKP